MKRVGKIILWLFVAVIAIGVINLIVTTAPATQTQKTTTTPKEAPKPQVDPGEITMEEFNQIQNGLALEQVEKIVGGKGELQSSAGDGQYKTEMYTWKGNGMGANANVTFQGGKVMAKAQFGLQ